METHGAMSRSNYRELGRMLVFGLKLKKIHEQQGPSLITHDYSSPGLFLVYIYLALAPLMVHKYKHASSLNPSHTSGLAHSQGDHDIPMLKWMLHCSESHGIPSI